MISRLARLSASLLLAASVAGCVSLPVPTGTEPRLSPRTTTEQSLHRLPLPAQPIVVSVYSLADKTGQHKPNDRFSEYSRAVTQGGTEMLIEALQEAGSGQWFVILDRASLNNILRERQIISTTREQYLGSDGQTLGPPPPLLYAPIVIEGAIISYETNTYTGGAGARFLGIGGSAAYEHDRVTVSLRASSTQNGRMLRSVSATKDIYSAGVQGGVFKFVDFDKILEAELGMSENEPPQLAVRRALEKAVYALVMEGALTDVWQFADPAAAKPLVDAYLEERDGYVSTNLPVPSSPGTLAPDADRVRVREPAPSTDFSDELARRLREASGADDEANPGEGEPDVYEKKPPPSPVRPPANDAGPT